MTFIFVSQLEIKYLLNNIILRLSVNANKKSGEKEGILIQAIKDMNDLPTVVIESYLHLYITN